MSVDSIKRCWEKRSRTLLGRRKKRAVSIAVTMPTSEPNVPGAFGAYPTPSAVAMARAKPGFSLEDSVDGFIGLSSGVFLRLEFVKLGFVEYRVGHHVFFA